ncbi:DUF7144 family membrane protein [Streptomyces antimicrobicus]|uniref:DUF7144 domain-containing protein n=1 Tax=Streptomyces antimicrobicus TaxID=2883108 RepID=A0ABS8BAS0_9ACTN|nr:hypothetical protein [Streptomyces antimicrobicus]MCB5181722.1 hypothetical protein [Streptomyces antimicrobicus]
MTTTPGSTPPAGTPGTSGGRVPTRSGSGGNAWANGGTVFAGVMLAVSGVFTLLEGIVALAKDQVYTIINDYIFKFDLTAWGWIHLLLGVLLLVTGLAILADKGWGRVMGIVFASLSVILHFLWLPYQPLWAIIAIAIAVFVIWALCADTRDDNALAGP